MSPADTPEDLAQQLRGLFFNVRETQPDAHLYVLLDQNSPVDAHHPLHRDSLGKREIKRVQALVKRPDLAHIPELCPIALQLHAAGENGYADEELIDLTAVTAFEQRTWVTGAYVAGWLASPASPDSLCKALGQNGVIYDPFRGGSRFLPLFEPYRMALLQSEAASAPQINAWLGEITHWFMLDVRAQLRTLKRSRALNPEAIPPRLSLNRDQTQAQRRVILGRHAMKMLHQEGALTQQRNSPERAIDQALVHAYSLGLKETEDVLFFVLNSFTLPAEWVAHPATQACIQSCISNQAPLAGLFSELDDATLASIATSPSPNI